MKFTLLIFLLCAAYFRKTTAFRPFFMNEKFGEFKEGCLEEAGMTMEELKSGPHDESASENHLCFVKCIMQKGGLIDAEGNIDTAKADALFESSPFDEEKQNEIKSCIAGAGKIEACEDTKNIFDCFPRRGKH